jgi:hypothetical protein
LVAAERMLPTGGGSVLFELLNQLEGLAEDADLLVVLSPAASPEMVRAIGAAGLPMPPGFHHGP